MKKQKSLPHYCICCMAFGYESTGRGGFSNDMTTFTSTYHCINVFEIVELRLDPGEAQEVDCN